MSSNETRELGRSAPSGFGWSEHRENGSLVAQVTGELDVSVSDEWEWRLTTAVESGSAAVVVLDLWDLTFIDAHSVGLIMAAQTAARRYGRRLQVDGLRGLPERVFNLLDLEALVAHPASQGAVRRDSRDRHQRTVRFAVRQRSVGGTHGTG